MTEPGGDGAFVVRPAGEAVEPGQRHLTASCLPFDRDREVVLLVLHKLTRAYQFPGGHLKPGESPDEAAVRELREETGLEAALWRGGELAMPGGVWRPSPIMTCDYPAPADPGWGELEHVHTDFLYPATADRAQPIVVQADEVDDAQWWPITELHRPQVRADVPVAVAVALRIPRPGCGLP